MVRLVQSATFALFASGCAHLPYPETEAGKAQVSEARYYQTMGGIFIGACVTAGVSGLVATKIVADAHYDSAPVLAATGVGVALNCIIGGILIKTGNEIARSVSYGEARNESAESYDGSSTGAL